MAKIRGVDGPGAPGGPEPVTEPAPVEAPGGVRPEEPAAAAAVATSPNPALALFDRIAERLAAGELTDRTAAVRAAVSEVLAERMAGLAEGTRDRLADQITTFMLDDPGLSSRLARLLEPA